MGINSEAGMLAMLELLLARFTVTPLPVAAAGKVTWNAADWPMPRFVVAGPVIAPEPFTLTVVVPLL